MPFLAQSALLHAIGYAIINSLWQVALLWIVVVLFNSLLKTSSDTRYKLALFAQVIGFTWFALTLRFYYQECASLSNAMPGAGNDFVPALHIDADGINTFLYNLLWNTEVILPYLSIAYLFLLGYLSFNWVRGFRQVSHLRNEGLSKIDVEWRLFTARTSQMLGIKQKVQIFLSQCATSPLTVGFFKPIILIPIASVNHLTPSQMEAVILHELAHIKRFDYLINILVTVSEMLLFFNPFTRLLGQLIRKERENSCDDWVLQFRYDAVSYAEALLRMAHLQPRPTFAMAASAGKNELLLRVRRMLNKQDKVFNYRQQLMAFTLLTAIISCFALYNPQVRSNVVSLETSGSKVVKPFIASIENPIFNPVYLIADPFESQLKKEVSSTAVNKNAEPERKIKPLNWMISRTAHSGQKKNEEQAGSLPVLTRAAATASTMATHTSKPVNMDTLLSWSFSTRPLVIPHNLEQYPAIPTLKEDRKRARQAASQNINQLREQLAKGRKVRMQMAGRRGQMVLDTLDHLVSINPHIPVAEHWNKIITETNYTFAPAAFVFDSLYIQALDKLRLTDSLLQTRHSKLKKLQDQNANGFDLDALLEQPDQKLPGRRKAVVVYDGNNRKAENISVIIELE